jgi:hypothetical protein
MLEFLSKYGVKIEEGDNTDCLITYTDKANIDELRKKYNCKIYIFISYDAEHDEEIVEMQPNITMKLALKNDDIASRE